MTAPYHPPVKRSVVIEGHRTSISLEPVFWDRLRNAAQAEGLSVNSLIARIDRERIAAATPPGLASAVRIWVLQHAPIRKEAPDVTSDASIT